MIMEGYRTVSIRKILFRDYWSFILFLFSAISLFAVVGIPFLLISIPLLMRRIGRIRNAIEEGMIIDGTVDRIDSSSSTRTVWYSYMVQGENYRTKNWSMKFGNSLRKNDKVEIAYSMEDPSIAFPVCLYAADDPPA